MVCTLVYINTSFLIYKNKAVDRQMLLITTLCIFVIKTLILAIRNVNGQTKLLVIITLCLLVCIYSVDNLCKRFGQNKVQQNIIIICPHMNLNQLVFEAFLEFLRKRNNSTIANIR